MSPKLPLKSPQRPPKSPRGKSRKSCVPDSYVSVPDKIVPDGKANVPDTTIIVPETTSFVPDTTPNVPDRTANILDKKAIVPDRKTERNVSVPDRIDIEPVREDVCLDRNDFKETACAADTENIKLQCTQITELEAHFENLVIFDAKIDVCDANQNTNPLRSNNNLNHLTREDFAVNKSHSVECSSNNDHKTETPACDELNSVSEKLGHLNIIESAVKAPKEHHEFQEEDAEATDNLESAIAIHEHGQDAAIEVQAYCEESTEPQIQQNNIVKVFEASGLDATEAYNPDQNLNESANQNIKVKAAEHLEGATRAEEQEAVLNQELQVETLEASVLVNYSLSSVADSVRSSPSPPRQSTPNPHHLGKS